MARVIDSCYCSQGLSEKTCSRQALKTNSSPLDGLAVARRRLRPRSSLLAPRSLSAASPPSDLRPDLRRLRRPVTCFAALRPSASLFSTPQRLNVSTSQHLNMALPFALRRPTSDVRLPTSDLFDRALH